MTRTSPLDRGGQAMGAVRVTVLVLAVFLLILGGALLALGPLLFRMRLIDLVTAMEGVQLVAFWCLAGAVGLGLLGLVTAFIGSKHRAGIVAVLVTAAAAMGAGSIYGREVSRDDLPPIYDAQTDWSRPVAFTEATLKSRADAGAVKVRDDAIVGEGNGRWTGMSFADAQAAFFKDVKPLLLNAPPADVTAAAARAMERMGWRVTNSDAAAGVVEGVFRSPWYELEHDVAVRVTMEGQGSRVDIRATSRVPGHDMGGNAMLVKELTDEIVLAL